MVTLNECTTSMVLLGLDSVPWRFDLLQKMEQHSLDEQSASIAQALKEWGLA